MAGNDPMTDIRDPRVIRVQLRYREAVAVATERAVRELCRIGVSEPDEALRRILTERLGEGTATAGRPG